MNKLSYLHSLSSAVWITIGLREDIFKAIATYYPMMLAMVVGSLVAGSTPLGGGVVAFPVGVLVLGFMPTQGRDFSLLIQSVGMTAASYLILYNKQHLIAGSGDFMAKMIIFSAVGLIIGFECLPVSPYIMNIVYTTTVVCIVCVLMYQDYVNKLKMRTPENAIGQERTNPIITKWDIPLVLFAIGGGLLTSQIGSGADITCYLFANFLSAFNKESVIGSGNYNDNSFTAMSVIVMASNSILGSVLRLCTQQNDSLKVSHEVLLCLFSCVPIVVLGAPIASLFLKPANQRNLRYAFYILGVLQLLIYGVIKIGDDVQSWIAIAASICAVCGALFLHYRLLGSIILVPSKNRQSGENEDEDFEENKTTELGQVELETKMN